MFRTLCRRLVTAALAAAAAAGVPLAGADDARAHGTVPVHVMGELSCGPGTVVVRTPRLIQSYADVNHRRPELVRWSPDLYRWNGRSWVLFDATAPWYEALTTFRYGFTQRPFGAWQRANSAGQVMFVPFRGLPSGVYTIRHFITWPGTTGAAQHGHWHDRVCAV